MTCDYTVDFGADAGTAEVMTYPELLQKAGTSWQVYTNDQVGDGSSYPDYFRGDYGDNPLWFHQQYNTSNSYYDMVITANASDGFRRRYAGRIARTTTSARRAMATSAWPRVPT
jgi:phospholipase C